MVMLEEDNSKLKKDYEYFDVTADIGFYAYGSSLEEAYENAGSAMFNVITDLEKVKPAVSREIEIVSEDLVSLLYDYLEELLFLQDVDFLFLSKFDVKIEKLDDSQKKSLDENLPDGEALSINPDEESSLSNYKLIATLYGEEINWDVHEHRSEVKAVTYHLMDVKKENGVYILRAILDL